MAHDVFVCHVPRNAGLAAVVCKAIEDAGLQCWIAPRDIPHGGRWEDAVLDAIETSRAMVALLPGFTLLAHGMEREVGHGEKCGVPVVGLRVETRHHFERETILNSMPALDATDGPLQDHLPAFLECLREALLSESWARCCVYCGMQFVASERRCAQCGTRRLPETELRDLTSQGCGVCSEINPLGHRFCRRCGTQIQSEWAGDERRGEVEERARAGNSTEPPHGTLIGTTVGGRFHVLG